MSIKKLPFNYTPVASSPTDANLFSIFSREEEILWFLNHFIMLTDSAGHIDGGVLVDNHIDFDISRYPLQLLRNCPLINFHGISKTFALSNYSRISDFIIHAINDGYYVYIYVETTCIKAYADYGSEVIRGHDMLIYGYNLADKTFNIADFFTSGHSHEVCSFDELEKASAEASRNYNFYENTIFLIKKSGTYQTKINVPLVKQLVNDYIRGESSVTLINKPLSLHGGNKFAYGTNIYKSLSYSIENETIALSDIVKPLHVMHDHKLIMLMLIERLYREGYLNNYASISNKLKELVKKLLTFRNFMIKCLIVGKADKSTILSKLAEVAENDTAIFNEIHDALTDNILPLNHGEPDVKSNAKFLYEDRETAKGVAWSQKYGNDGYYIVGCPAKTPSIAKYRICDANFVLHPDADNRALFVPGRDVPTEVGVLYSFNQFFMDFYAEHTTQVAFYFYNHERDVKDFTIDFVDLNSNEKILEYTPIDFNEGMYVSFAIQGHVRLIFRSIGKVEDYSNAIICAIFFDAIQ